MPDNEIDAHNLFNYSGPWDLKNEWKNFTQQ